MSENKITVGLADKEYFAIDRVSKHALDEFAKNPYAYLARKVAGIEEEEKDSAALILGRAAHAAVLQPEIFDGEFVIQPDHIKVRRGKEWEIFNAMSSGKFIIKQDDYDIAKGISKSVAANATSSKLLAACEDREVAVFWKDDTGVEMKAKIDFISKNGAIVGDLKTTTDASPDAFAKDCDIYGYDIQAAVYVDAVRAAGYEPKCFAFIVVEKTFPFTVSVYTFDTDSDFIRAGRLAYREQLALYAEMLSNPASFSYDRAGWKEHNLSLPTWSKRAKHLAEVEAEAITQTLTNS